MSEHNELNAASRQRLEQLISGLDATALRLPMGEHWTIAAGLLHVSFWDSFTRERWADAERLQLQTPRPVEGHVEDQVNDTLTPLLLAVDVARVAELVLHAARTIDAYIARLPDEIAELVRAENRPRLLDRSIHRFEHLAEIESLLAERRG